MKYESNIFKIENLNELTANYVLFEIIGLNDTDDDFDNNIQYLIKSLSYCLKHPVTVVHKLEKPFLVVKDQKDILDKMPVEHFVMRNETVYFKKVAEPLRLDFVNYDAESKIIILRFLQFDIQTELNSDIASETNPESYSESFTDNLDTDEEILETEEDVLLTTDSETDLEEEYLDGAQLQLGQAGAAEGHTQCGRLSRPVQLGF